MKKLSTLATLLICSVAAAAGNGAHGASHGLDEHQIKTIMYQSINAAILFFGLFHFTKKPIIQLFKDKRALFLMAAEKAQEARATAECEKIDIQIRLTKLEATAEESVARARAEAADMKKQLIEEAKNLSKRIREEASGAAQLETEKAKYQIRSQMIMAATEIAHQQMKSKVSSADHKRLQVDFIENIEAVRQ